MQQCWKGSVGAVDKASSGEHSNTRNCLLQDPSSTAPNTDGGYGPATVLQTLLLRADVASSRLHPCSLFAAAEAWFHVVTNGSTELEHIVRMRLWCNNQNITGVRANSMEERERDLWGCLAASSCCQTNCNHLTQTATRVYVAAPASSSVTLIYQKHYCSLLLNFIGCAGPRNRH